MSRGVPDQLFYIGAIWVAAGFLAIVGLTAAFHLQTPPLEAHLTKTSGVLASVEIRCPSKAPAWADISLNAANEQVHGRIHNIVFLWPECCGSGALKSLKLGEDISIWRHGERVWAISAASSPLLTYNQSKQAEYALLIRRLEVFGFIFVIGAVPVLWRLYTKMRSNHVLQRTAASGRR